MKKILFLFIFSITSFYAAAVINKVADINPFDMDTTPTIPRYKPSPEELNRIDQDCTMYIDQKETTLTDKALPVGIRLFIENSPLKSGERVYFPCSSFIPTPKIVLATPATRTWGDVFYDVFVRKYTWSLE